MPDKLFPVFPKVAIALEIRFRLIVASGDDFGSNESDFFNFFFTL